MTRTQAEKKLLDASKKQTHILKQTTISNCCLSNKRKEINANKSPVTRMRLQNLKNEGIWKNKVKSVNADQKFNYYRNHSNSNFY
jgi:hypothetical protein